MWLQSCARWNAAPTAGVLDSGVCATRAGLERRAPSETVIVDVLPVRTVTVTTARASVSQAGTANTAH